MMGLIKLNVCEIRKHKEKQPKELGCMKGLNVTFKLKPDAEPSKVVTARRIAILLREAVNEELYRMQQMGVIESINEPIG